MRILGRGLYARTRFRIADGDFSAAVEALEKSLELKGRNSWDWFFLGMAYWRLGDKAAALRWYDKAVYWTNAGDGTVMMIAR